MIQLIFAFSFVSFVFSLSPAFQNGKTFTGIQRRPIQLEIVPSAILGAVPWLELHHIVVLRDPKVPQGVYSIDFSPVKHQHWKTLALLLFGQNVEGVVRVRWIPDAKLSLNEIKNNCMFWDHRFFDKLESSGLNNGGNSDLMSIEAFLLKLKTGWKGYMNLYYHNCQHFSMFVKRKAKEEFDLSE